MKSATLTRNVAIATYLFSAYSWISKIHWSKRNEKTDIKCRGDILSFNYHAVNTLTGQTCGHHHHSIAKAKQCIDWFGWNDCGIVEKFADSKEEHRARVRDSITESDIPYIDDYDGDAIYDVTLRLSIKALSANIALDAFNRWFKNIEQANAYAGREIKSVEARIEEE